MSDALIADVCLAENRLTVRIKNIVVVPSCRLRICYCCVWKAVKRKGRKRKRKGSTISLMTAVLLIDEYKRTRQGKENKRKLVVCCLSFVAVSIAHRSVTVGLMLFIQRYGHMLTSRSAIV
jgi:hypothetical protein